MKSSTFDLGLNLPSVGRISVVSRSISKEICQFFGRSFLVAPFGKVSFSVKNTARQYSPTHACCCMHAIMHARMHARTHACSQPSKRTTLKREGLVEHEGQESQLRPDTNGRMLSKSCQAVIYSLLWGNGFVKTVIHLLCYSFIFLSCKLRLKCTKHYGLSRKESIY
jgi:hypothetical protein